MKDITCPKCGTVFQVDESHYAEIVAQVRTALFSEEIERRTLEIERQFQAQQEAVRLKAERSLDSKFAAKDREIADLRTQIATADARHSLDIIRAQSDTQKLLAEKERRIVELTSDLKAAEDANQLRVRQLKEQHSQLMQLKDGEIAQLRDFRQRLSTKMLGESLEQHCANEFEQAQSLGLFPDAQFCKDNIVADGTKGDFIFRDFMDGEAYISVMFEMKTEMETTATKHRNDDFLEKLDRDRRNKGCEYAILVTTLEQGVPAYDNGICDKSHRYPKMLVIRPQFFLPVLRLISEAARKGFIEHRELRLQLMQAQEERYDFTRFEEKINRFRDSFNGQIVKAKKKFDDANSGIDKVIASLEKQIEQLRRVKESFEASKKGLLRANEMAEEDLTVKKLTHGNPNIRRLIQS